MKILNVVFGTLMVTFPAAPDSVPAAVAGLLLKASPGPLGASLMREAQ